MEYLSPFNQLLALIAVFTVVTIILFGKVRRQKKRLDFGHARLLEEISAVRANAAVMLNQIRSLEQQLGKTIERQGQIQSRDLSGFAYTQASKLLQMGAEKEQLMSNCGVSLAEAKLLDLMHRKSAQS